MQRLSLLFLCTGNSCRSQMAEGWAKNLFASSPLAQRYQIEVYSAGIEAHGLNPKALEVMAELGVDISQQTSDLLDQDRLAQVDWVISLCDHADQHCPVLPASVQRLHWGMPDPAKADAAEGLAPYRACRDQLALTLRNFIDQLETQPSRLLNPCFGQEDYQITAKQSPFKGFFEMQTLRIKHRLYEGGWSPEFSRELFVRGLAVVALLYDPQRDQLVLVEQFRVGALADQRSPWLLELVAGMVEEGENPEEVVRREALEEAGCVVGEMVKLYDYWVSPGATSEQVAIYCARVDTEGLGGVHGLEHEHEDIRVEVVDSDWAFDAMATGVINNAATIMALQWLQLNKSRIRSLWR